MSAAKSSPETPHSVKIRFGAWYDDRDLELVFPDGWQVALCPPNDGPDIGVAGIEAAFANPIGTPRLRELAAGKRLYAHCKLGGRSAKALIALKREGIEGTNVSGGIDAWSQEIDPSVQRY